jgi:hypothetical protein
MSNNSDNNNNNRISPGGIDPRYNVVPMDLNSSPLQDHLEQQAALLPNNTTIKSTAAAVTAHNNGKAMPVLIPPGLSENTHDKKKRHHKRRRKLAQTFPDDSLEAVLERRKQNMPLQPPPLPGLQSNTNAKGGTKSSQSFIVGSLQEKPPVPWPTNLTTPPDSVRRLTNRMTVNWPLLPESLGGSKSRRDYSNLNEEEEDDDIFSMDNDFYNGSELDEDNYSSDMKL